MKNIVAVIDAGGRGSALVDAYAKSDKVDEIIAIPGNDLMQINTKKKVRIFPHLKTTSKIEILKICKEYKVALVDIAQENAILAGVSDLLRKNNFKVFGPSRKAGQIEWDKSYAREFMLKYNLPAPKFWVFSNHSRAEKFLKSKPEQPFVIKASGLAEGKGVIIAQNIAQALNAVSEMARFGSSGETFLIEEFLEGEEFSSYAISDGKTFQYIASAQDHKRVFDGDKGLNTGGMGCSTPPLVINSNIQNQISDIFNRTFEGLKKENRPYSGILYLGGIVAKNKVNIIEFNARWGDPEVECILPGIKNDWFDVALSIAQDQFDKTKVNYNGKARIVVAAASKGYPGDYSNVKGKVINGFDNLIKTPGIKLYGAGVKEVGGRYLANGGRLFYVVAEGKNVIGARKKAYEALEKVFISGENGENLLHYRKDIGYRDVARLSK
ncbi:phosphoribosylamine--glycine ligase [Candidatus Daviesbacteria bacterium]|nr:phosphoribosylamine--glycine ligase [Candidatus Daviesbacteria bacterium]